MAGWLADWKHTKTSSNKSTDNQPNNISDKVINETKSITSNNLMVSWLVGWWWWCCVFYFFFSIAILLLFHFFFVVVLVSFVCIDGDDVFLWFVLVVLLLCVFPGGVVVVVIIILALQSRSTWFLLHISFFSFHLHASTERKA